MDSGVPGLQLVCLEHDTQATRASARSELRLALRERVAEQLHVDIGRVEIASEPGVAPQLLIDGSARAGGISLAHDGNRSIAAWYQHGAVGIDILQVQDTADWNIVARDYLGPDILKQLLNLSASARPQAFAQAWTEREAHLKFLGQPLSEWTTLPATCSFHRLALTADYAAAVAIKKGHD